jgi:GTP cyclohydrolase I
MTDIYADDFSIDELLQLNARKISPENISKFEGYMAEIFTAMGMDIDTPSTHETPRRFLEALMESTSGYEGDPKLIKAFPKECLGEPDCRLSQVIDVFPFYGEAYLGYVADERILGISKLTRLVRLYTKRFAVQERIGYQIADTLEAVMKPHGVAVFMRAKHMCVEMRGVREISPATRTTVFRGVYSEDASLRSEFLTVCGIIK